MCKKEETSRANRKAQTESALGFLSQFAGPKESADGN